MIAQERVTRGPDGLVSPFGDHEARRIGLKKAFADGTVAVDMTRFVIPEGGDPLSLLSRLASVPSPRRHTVRHAGVLASASKLRPRIGPKGAVPKLEKRRAVDTPGREAYWPWADLLKRTFALDLACPRCQGRLRVLAVVTDPASVARYLAGIGEATEPPAPVPARGPPYWKSRVLRRGHLGDHAAE